jgi:hypothetical protein
MAVDWSKVDDMTLALLYLTAFDVPGGTRSWKGHDWEVMNRLHEKGYISDPASKARSIVLTGAGRERARAAFREHFGADEIPRQDPAATCECGCGAPGPGFRPGHDQKLRASLESRAGGLLQLRTLVEAAESYASGEATVEELGQIARATFWKLE